MKRIKIIFAILFVVILTAFSTVGALAETVYSIGGYSFSILNNSEIALCGWDNSTPELVVPSEIANKTLVEVYKRGLEGNDGFSTLDFSQADNLKTIGYGSFMNCTGISNELVIPMQVKVIGFSAFENCTSIPSVIINADVSEIQSATFRGCTSLERVEINGTTKTIGYQAFADCPNLSYVQIPKSVYSISAQAFTNSPNAVIGCYYNSYAHEYAKAHNIPFILLDSVLLGDANGDGYVNISDVTDIQRAVAEIDTLDDLRKKAADVNGDGVVTIDDATILQMYLAEFATDYPIGVVTAQ